MSDPYLGEIRMWPGNRAPRGWEFCHGQLLQISQYQHLYSLIGTTYGGDGQTTFGLPDLQGRVPVHQGSGFTLGQKEGAEDVTLTLSELPSHTHALRASRQNALSVTPDNTVLAQPTTLDVYRAGENVNAPMSTDAVLSVGGDDSHPNIQPFLCINFVIALFGFWPEGEENHG